jgi:hypothetical protein
VVVPSKEEEEPDVPHAIARYISNRYGRSSEEDDGM